ncbi:unnamed protein product [Pleuronectes platessa]|uniref:Uncharacterized protein n=1 Tax=Pleuronectes platessa TaxID=8262 RepID=A0A9N7UBG3_PLEPL|nr:unnamed protein product [Pleuronectes platessa]
MSSPVYSPGRFTPAGQGAITSPGPSPPFCPPHYKRCRVQLCGSGPVLGTERVSIYLLAGDLGDTEPHYLPFETFPSGDWQTIQRSELCRQSPLGYRATQEPCPMGTSQCLFCNPSTLPSVSSSSTPPPGTISQGSTTKGAEPSLRMPGGQVLPYYTVFTWPRCLPALAPLGEPQHGGNHNRGELSVAHLGLLNLSYVANKDFLLRRARTRTTPNGPNRTSLLGPVRSPLLIAAGGRWARRPHGGREAGGGREGGTESRASGCLCWRAPSPFHPPGLPLAGNCILSAAIADK